MKALDIGVYVWYNQYVAVVCPFCDTHGGVASLILNDLYADKRCRYSPERVLSASVFAVLGKELMRCDTDADLFEGR